MNKIILATVMVWASLYAGNTYAQERLTVTLESIASGQHGMPIDRPAASMSVVNRGDQASPPFTLKLWASIDSNFTDDDVPVTLDSASLPACTDPRNCPRSNRLSRFYRLPLPGQVITPSDRLFGDNRTVSEWMGERVYYQGCISINGGPFERCVTHSNVVTAPSASSVSASRGNFNDRVHIKWVQDLDELDNPLATDFRVMKTRLDSVGGGEILELTMADLEIDSSGSRPQYRYIDTNVARGVLYNYVVRNCNNASGAVLCQNSASVKEAFASAEYQATAGSELDQVRVNWHQHSVATPGYDVHRCVLGSTPNCTKIADKVTVLEYIDTTVTPGEQYFYRIYACLSSDTTDPTRCVRQPYEIGQTNIGFAPLIDAYEDDDIPYQGTLVDRSATQSRTFDVIGDQDWVKIMVGEHSSLTMKTSGSVNIDTKLTLFDDTATNQIAFSDHTPGEPTEHALLRQPSIAPGTYFLLVEQGGSPVPNVEYLLEISFGSPGPTEDIFEPDNSAATAKLVRRSVSQTRSFHVADDIDWVRLELDRAQAITVRTTGEIFVDTQLWLYDSELNEIEYSPNTPGMVTAHATIESDRLTKGTYFLKVSQQRKPGFPFPPIETYGLEITLQDAAPVNMVPIIDLLLSDDPPREQSDELNDLKSVRQEKISRCSTNNNGDCSLDR